MAPLVFTLNDQDNDIQIEGESRIPAGARVQVDSVTFQFRGE
jgi:hypothetical protein